MQRRVCNKNAVTTSRPRRQLPPHAKALIVAAGESTGSLARAAEPPYSVQHLSNVIAGRRVATARFWRAWRRLRIDERAVANLRAMREVLAAARQETDAPRGLG